MHNIYPCSPFKQRSDPCVEFIYLLTCFSSESTYATTVRDSKRCRERDFLKKVHDCIDKVDLAELDFISTSLINQISFDVNLVNRSNAASVSS